MRFIGCAVKEPFLLEALGVSPGLFGSSRERTSVLRTSPAFFTISRLSQIYQSLWCCLAQRVLHRGPLQILNMLMIRLYEADRAALRDVLRQAVVNA